MDGNDAIPVDECWQLLATTDVGRVAVSIGALPALLPVRYAVGDGEIAMCLGELKVPYTSAHDAIVAFSADDLSSDRYQGWYVHAVGASTLEPVAEGPVVRGDMPAAWQVLRLVPTIVLGHRLHLRPPPTGR